MRLIRCLALILLAAAMTAPVAAQRQKGRGFGGGFGGFGSSPFSLAGQKSVQEELKLDADQVKKITELSEKQRDSFRGLRELKEEERRQKFEEMNKANDQAVAALLKPEQNKRLKQIAWQRQGSRAFTLPEVADGLKLTAEQKDKIKTIQEDAQKDMAALFGGGNREEARKKMQELLKESSQKTTDVLTDEQKTKWKEMTGEPFKGEIRRQGGGRPKQT